MVEVLPGLHGKIYFGTTINVTALMLSFTEMVADQNGNFVTRLSRREDSSIAKTCVPVFYYKFVFVL